jgi:hypothetical protein
VAFATIALVVVTLGLFIATLRVAKTTQREVQAQWRPALVPGRTITEEYRPNSVVIPETPAIYIARSGGRLTVALHNAGTGPALDVEATLHPGGIPMASLGDANVILAGEQRWLSFSAPTPVHHRLTATYRDLGNTKYTTTVDVFFEYGMTGTVDDEGDTIGWAPARSSFGPVSLGKLWGYPRRRAARGGAGSVTERQAGAVEPRLRRHAGGAGGGGDFAVLM